MIEVLVPENLHLEQLLAEIPPDFSFKPDCFYYLISQIIELRGYSDKLKEQTFIPLMSEILKKKIHNAHKYLKYLTENGVLETDGFYIPKEKCYGYRLAEQYAKAELIPVTLTDFVLIRNLKQEQKHRNHAKEKYSHLWHWFNDELQLDFGKCLEYLKELRTQELLQVSSVAEERFVKRYKTVHSAEPLSTTPKDKIYFAQLEREITKVHETYQTRMTVAHKLYAHNYRFNTDKTSGRLHTNIVGLKKQLRKHLSYKGQPLINVDLKNSQPLFSLLLFNSQFYDGIKPQERSALQELIDLIKSIETGLSGSDNFTNQIDTTVRFQGIKQSIVYKLNRTNNKTNNNTESVSIKSPESPQGAGCQDVVTYFEQVSSGKIYEYLQTHMNLESRAAGKKMFFTIVFGDPHAAYGKAEREQFQKLFPTVYKVFMLVKAVKYQHLAILLQTIEATVMLDQVTKQIAQQNKQLPIYTIHDSILTLADHKEAVKIIMLQVISEHLGVVPSVEFEG